MKEEKIVRKFFWVWEFEKEEQWLNAMAQSGWVLSKVGFCAYHFVPCQPGEYTVRMEMHQPDDAYLQFMEDTGAQYVGRIFQWVYFRKKTDLGGFDLFSDLDSRLAHLKRIGNCLGLLGLANLVIGLANTFGAGHRFGWVSLLCATLLMYALGRIHGKIEVLSRERLLQEN